MGRTVSARPRAGRRRAGLAAMAAIGLALAAAGCGATADVDPSADAAEPITTPHPTARSAAATAADVSLRPPPITIVVPARGTAPGFLFTAPKRQPASMQAGPMIYDNAGHLVWFKPMTGTDRAYNFGVQKYRGKPVLTWWQGDAGNGFGTGEDEIYDAHYHHIATVKAGNGLQADFHEFIISPQNTALLIAYVPGRRDATKWGGTKDDRVIDNVIQEIDIKTGKVLLQWSGLDHLSPGVSYSPPPHDPAKDWDPLHLNSIAVEPDGNLLVSARDAHATYEIDRHSGTVLWTLGGKDSDYKMGPGTRVAWQHDARRLPNGNLTWFDNNAVRPTKGKFSRGVEVAVDQRARTVTLVHQWKHAPAEVSTSQANMQTRPNGDVLMGWSAQQPNLTEYSRSGKVKFEARFAAPYPIDSYRAFRFPWKGLPTDPPQVSVQSGGPDPVAVVSWNGATEVATWRLLAVDESGRTTVLREQPRTDFATSLAIPRGTAQIAVEAVDKRGTALGRSALVKLSG